MELRNLIPWSSRKPLEGFEKMVVSLECREGVRSIGEEQGPQEQ